MNQTNAEFVDIDRADNILKEIAETIEKRRVSGAEQTEGDLRLKLRTADSADAVSVLSSMGYRIEDAGDGEVIFKDPVDILRAGSLTENLPDSPFTNNLILKRKTGSTNSDLSKLARHGAPHGTVILAEEQVAGRGRFGRAWFSPPGVGLWFSVLLRVNLPQNCGGRVTMLAAAAIASALRESTGLPVSVRWPNDLFLSGRKLCGVLSEGELSDGRLSAVVMGAGLNVNIREEDFPAEFSDSAISLCSAAGRSLDRRSLFRSILTVLGKEFGTPGWEDGERGFALWNSLFDMEGSVVSVGSVKGKILHADKDGGLVLERKSGERIRVVSGDMVPL